MYQQLYHSVYQQNKSKIPKRGPGFTPGLGRACAGLAPCAARPKPARARPRVKNCSARLPKRTPMEA